jgi:hypothetical protein
MSNSVLKVIVNGIALVPLTWICILYSFTAFCWLKLGHFPVPSLDDPKDLGFSLLYYLAVIGMIISLPIMLIWIILLPFTVKQKLLSRKTLVIMLTGSIIAMLQLFADPFNLIYWLLD